MRHLEASQVNRLPAALPWRSGIVPVAVWLTVVVAGTVQAGGFRSPEECRAYTGQAHLQCLYEYIGVEEELSGTGEEKADSERDMLEQLREQRAQAEGRASFQHEFQGNRTDRTERSTEAGAPPARSATAASSFRSPEECRAYSGDAHLNCLYAYIEMQRSRLGKVEEELRAQDGMLQQLREQVDRQAALGDDLERRLAERQSTSRPANVYVTPPAPVYPPGYLYPGYAYSSPGLSLYFGLPGYSYGSPFYGPRFFGPRLFAPRYYAPRFFGSPGFSGPRAFGHRR